MKVCRLFYICLILIALPISFIACSNDDEEEPIGPIGIPWGINCRIDLYNADGTPYEILPAVGDKIRCKSGVCEDIFNRPHYYANYSGNSFYAGSGDFSGHQHPGHEHDITFTIYIQPSDLFGWDEEKTINIVCDPCFEQNLSPFMPVVKSVTSDNLNVSSTLTYEEMVETDGTKEYYLPITVILPEKN